MYGEEVPLSDLYEFPENREKIEHYCNRKPTLEKGGYRLDFRGRAECKSIKNFIVERPNGKEVVMFGKVDESTFNI